MNALSSILDQRRIQVLAKHLWRTFLRKQLTAEIPQLFPQKASSQMFDWILNLFLYISSHGILVSQKEEW